MGVIYKLKPEIKDFILKEKNNNLAISCRKLSILLGEKFGVKVSKSSINQIFKESGLSMPVGRRQKKKRQSREVEGFGAILLFAADALIGGCSQMAEAIGRKLGIPSLKVFPGLASMLCQDFSPETWLFSLFGEGKPAEGGASFQEDLKNAESGYADLAFIINKSFQEVRGVKLVLSDASAFYMDGQSHTLWPVPYIPFDFCTTLCDSMVYIKKVLTNNSPFILHFAQGEGEIPADFFDFLSALEGKRRYILQFVFYDHNLKELGNLRLPQANKFFWIFGLKPQQYQACARLKQIGEYRPYDFQPLQAQFYVADAEVILSQHIDNIAVTFRGCAVKKDKEGKPFFMLSNLPYEQGFAEKVADLYLNHWPNMAEGFQDAQRKIEFFAYTAATPGPSLQAYIDSSGRSGKDVSSVLANYLKGLDFFVRRYFLPSGYESSDFSTTKERFFSLKTRIRQEKDCLAATFLTPPGYPFRNDLAYAVSRVNERSIILPAGKRLWLRLE